MPDNNLLTLACSTHDNHKRGGFPIMNTQLTRTEDRSSRSNSPPAEFLLWFKTIPILRLAFSRGAWELAYTPQFKSQSRLPAIVCFPDVDKVYRSAKLWPFFSVRIPSIARPEVQRTVREEHLDYDDVAAMLRRFGRKSVADPFELRPDPDANELVGAN